MPTSDEPLGIHRAAPLRDQVYAALETMIVEGVLVPGSRLIESDLAARLGVSRNPVRESLTGLSRAGWVEIRPRHGVFVRDQREDDAREFFDFRQLLEVESARLAALHATEEDIVRLRMLIDDAAPLVEREAEQELTAANSAFHQAFAELSDNRHLQATIERLDKQLRWYFAPVATVRARRSWREHADLVRAMEAHDGTAAADAMRRHTEATAAAYFRGRASRTEPT